MVGLERGISGTFVPMVDSCCVDRVGGISVGTISTNEPENGGGSCTGCFELDLFNRNILFNWNFFFFFFESRGTMLTSVSSPRQLLTTRRP